MKKKTGLIVLFAVFLCGIVAIAIMVGYPLLSASSSQPTIAILQPITPEIIDSGQSLTILAQADAEAGLDRVELLVDGEYYTQQSADGAESYIAAIPWYAAGLGKQTLELVAYDTDGQASESVTLLVGTRPQSASGSLDFVYIPSEENQEPTGQEGTPEDTAPVGNAGNQPAPAGRIIPIVQVRDDNAEQLNGDEPNPDVQNPAGILGEPLTQEDFDALPEPTDNKPIITSFEVTPHRLGTDVVPAYALEAQDYKGLASLEVYIEYNGGDATYRRAHACGGEMTCSAADFFPFPQGPGTWLITVYAIDISGQSSTPQFATLEVADSDNADPAVAIQGFDIAQMGNIINVLPDQAAFDLGDNPFADNVPANNAPPPEDILVAGAVTNEHPCARGSATPRTEGGIVISVINLCEEEAPAPGYYLVWEITAKPTGASGPYRTIYRNELTDFTSMFVDQNFAYLHENPPCGNIMYYRVFLRWKGPTGDERYAGGLDLRDVSSNPCGADAFIQNFQAEASETGVNLTWTFDPQGERINQYNYQVSRFNRSEGEFVLIAEGIFGSSDQPMPFSFLDTTGQCGFRGYLYHIQTSYRIDGIRMSAGTRIDRIPCPEGSVGNIPINLTAGYKLKGTTDPVDGYYATAVTAQSVIPANYPWPAGNNLMLRLSVQPIGSIGDFSLVPGNTWDLSLTDQIKSEGYTFSDTFFVKCSSLHFQWAVSWELLSDGQIIDAGLPTKINSPPCLPNYTSAPLITQIYGSSDPAVCGNQPYCVVIEWGELPPSTLEATIQHPVNGFGVHRSLASTEGVERTILPSGYWVLSADQQQYIDSNITCVEAGTNYTIRYTLRPLFDQLYQAQRGPNTAFIDAPICGQPYDAVGNMIGVE